MESGGFSYLEDAYSPGNNSQNNFTLKFMKFRLDDCIETFDDLEVGTEYGSNPLVEFTFPQNQFSALIDSFMVSLDLTHDLSSNFYTWYESKIFDAFGDDPSFELGDVYESLPTIDYQSTKGYFKLNTGYNLYKINLIPYVLDVQSQFANLFQIFLIDQAGQQRAADVNDPLSFEFNYPAGGYNFEVNYRLPSGQIISTSNFITNLDTTIQPPSISPCYGAEGS